MELAAQDFDEPGPHDRYPPATEYSVADILMVVFRICFGSNFLFYLCHRKDLETGAGLKSVGIVTSTGVNTATFQFSTSAERRMAVLP